MSENATIHFNGPILTVDSNDTIAEAVGVVGERIFAVGSLAEVTLAMPNSARVHDLDGKTMIPAFIDPHGHFPDPGFVALFRVNLSSPPLGNCLHLEHVFERLRDKAARSPDGEWVMGVMFDHTALEERRFPTRAELDAISTRHPIWVLHASGHSGSANSLALASQNITETIDDPIGGLFFRDPETGLLNGIIEGIAAMGALGDTHFLINEERYQAGFDTARQEYLSQGVTLAQNAWASHHLLNLFAGSARDNDPGMDVLVLPVGELEPDFSNGKSDIEWTVNDHILLGPRKLFTDGAFQMQTALLSEPYYRPANGNPDHIGMSYVEPDVLNAKVQLLHDLGLQIHTHANGDAGADMFLDAVEKALENNPRTDHRHTVIHGQALREDQLDRMARLGVTVSFFAAHIYYWGDRHYDTFLGPERACRISPAASAQRRGIRYTIHNDASVTPTRPLHLMACSVNRTTASGRVLGQEQRVSARQALRAHTADAAWQVFLEKERGSIEVGKLAEFAILSDNPLENPDTMAQIQVEQTIRRGKLVYSK